MSSGQPGTLRPPSAGLASQFTIESHMLSTRSADAYKAVERTQGMGVCLWMLRHPLRQNSEAVRRFLSRIEKIKEIDPSVSEIESFGVDSTGMAYAVLPALDGTPVVSGRLETAEAERRFISCLKLVERLHAAGIVCGDLCASSFWSSRSGDVKLIGVMGSFDTEAAATAMLPPMDTLSFVAPEQRSGGGLEPASDVFALGVLGYYMLTGTYPYPSGAAMFAGELSPDQIKPISAFVQVSPVWAEEVLMKCLQSKPTSRYANAGEVHKAIVEIRQRVASGDQSLTRSARDAVLVGKGPSKSAAIKMPVVSGQPASADSKAPPAPEPSRRAAYMKLGLFVGVLIAIVFGVTQFFRERDAGQQAERAKELQQLKEAAGDQKLKNAISVLGQQEASLEERQTQLDKLASSDDPLAGDLLLKNAKSAKNDQERGMAEKAIIDRARRLGLMRAAEQVRQWLRGVKSTELPACYEAVLRSLDSTLPIDARGVALKQVYASNPKLALRLTAAIALDTNKYDDYQPILAQLLSDFSHNDEASGRSLLGLILSDPELAIVYGDDVIQRRDQIPEKDTIWVLKLLADRNDSNVRAVANLAMERNLLSPLRKTFLAYVRDRSDLPPTVLGALIRASAGALKPADVGEFGRWYDVESERVLLAIMADYEDTEVLTEAFDTIAGKSLTIEPSATLVDWVRQNHWDQRAEFAHLIGLVANISILGDNALNATIPVFDKYAKEKGFIDVLLKVDNPQLAQIVADRYADKLGLGGMINLLDSRDRKVRITAVKSLKDINEISILKIIIDKYEKEKDPEVRQVYRDTFWVIKEREGK